MTPYPLLTRRSRFRLAHGVALAISVGFGSLGAGSPALAQSAPNGKIARDLALVIAGAPVQQLNWAKDSQGVRLVKTIIVAVPGAAPT